MVWSSYYHRDEPDPLNLPAVFAAIISGLCAVVAQHAVTSPFLFQSLANPLGQPSGPFTFLLVGRLRCLVRRFESLVTRFRAGRLVAPRLRPRRPSAGERFRAEQPPRLPTAQAWLINLIPWKAAAFGSQLQHVLATNSELAALIEAAPLQTGRILRPLSRMLAFPLPPALLPPPRKRPRPDPSPHKTEQDSSPVAVSGRTACSPPMSAPVPIAPSLQDSSLRERSEKSA